MKAMLERTAALAIDGGTPTRTVPFAPWPAVAEEEVEAAADVLRSGRINYWTGEQGRRFEEEFASFVGCRHAVALANGTVALELALAALGIGPGDEVIAPSRTFIASASCAVMRGATPVFADVDPDSGTITAETVLALLTDRTRAIVAVHLAGWPCDLDPLLALARERGIAVIEDCAQAHGATYKSRAVGSLGHIGVFSFCQDKIMTTGGEGGMLVTDDPGVWDRAWSFKDHGKSHAAVFERVHAPGFRWVHESLGTNWRLTEMQSAMGRVLLRALPGMVETRRQHAAMLAEGFSNIPGLRVPRPPDGFGHSYYKFYAYVHPEALAPGWTRDRVMEAIAAEGVPCMAGSCSEIYLERAFSEIWRPRERLEHARRLGETSLMFVVHPTLCEQDMWDTVEAVDKVMRAATS